MGIVSSAKRRTVHLLSLRCTVSIPDGDSFLREVRSSTYSYYSISMFQSPMGIVSSAKTRGLWVGVKPIMKFQSPMGIVSSAKRRNSLMYLIQAAVSIPDGDSFLREVKA